VFRDVLANTAADSARRHSRGRISWRAGDHNAPLPELWVQFYRDLSHPRVRSRERNPGHLWALPLHPLVVQRRL